MSSSLSVGKSFDISKREVWEAYQRVLANKGAPGCDGQTLDEFQIELKGNLYKIWNRMSSGSYFPPPVRAVEIPKAAGGVRVLGVPTVADRVAQTVVARRLEAGVESKFHADSYGYRPGRRSALSPLLLRVNTYLARWAQRKYKGLRAHKRLRAWWERFVAANPTGFAHWQWIHHYLLPG